MSLFQRVMRLLAHRGALEDLPNWQGSEMAVSASCPRADLVT